MAKKNLVIVESPAKAKTIGKYLGRDYTVTASMGHLRDLPKSKLGVEIENDFEPDYKPIKGKETLIRELKKAAAESDVVYLATDPDREGEAISWHLKALLGLDDEKAKRVTFNEITKRVVTESIREPRAIDQNLVLMDGAPLYNSGHFNPLPNILISPIIALLPFPQRTVPPRRSSNDNRAFHPAAHRQNLHLFFDVNGMMDSAHFGLSK